MKVEQHLSILEIIFGGNSSGKFSIRHLLKVLALVCVLLAASLAQPTPDEQESKDGMGSSYNKRA